MTMVVKAHFLPKTRVIKITILTTLIIIIIIIIIIIFNE